MGPGRAEAIVAGNLLRKQQLLIVNRYRKHASNLSAIDRVLLLEALKILVLPILLTGISCDMRWILSLHTH